MFYREYEKDELVKVGDVVQVFEGPFGTAIVTRVEPQSPPAKEGDVWIHLERPHLKMEGTGGSSVAIMTERFMTHKKGLKVCVTPRGNKENRWY